jgi:hypothetical protein
VYADGGGGYGTAVGEAVAARGVHGFPAMRTSFIGRAGPARELAALVERHPLVTVTGPGGSGKTRLACEVARRVAGRFADGVWLVELAPVRDPGQVPGVAAAALGVREQAGVPVAGTLARVLARQQLLVVLDNCEHVLGAAAGLCAELSGACDDVRVLATSREPLRVAGEARYRLGPLAVPELDDLAGAATAEAVVLFADRARAADAHFVLDGRTGPGVARLVARLDGMPLAIELAAARAEALGVAGLLDRIEDRFALLAGGDRLAPARRTPRRASLAVQGRQSRPDPSRQDHHHDHTAVSSPVPPPDGHLDGRPAPAGHRPGRGHRRPAGIGRRRHGRLRLPDPDRRREPSAGGAGPARYRPRDHRRRHGGLAGRPDRGRGRPGRRGRGRACGPQAGRPPRGHRYHRLRRPPAPHPTPA